MFIEEVPHVLSDNMTSKIYTRFMWYAQASDHQQIDHRKYDCLLIHFPPVTAAKEAFFFFAGVYKKKKKCILVLTESSCHFVPHSSFYDSESVKPFIQD